MYTYVYDTIMVKDFLCNLSSALFLTNENLTPFSLKPDAFYDES